MVVFANNCGEKNKFSLISLGGIRLDSFEQWQEFQSFRWLLLITGGGYA